MDSLASVDRHLGDRRWPFAVLVVDDEPDMRNALARGLQTLDFIAIRACDGVEALAIINAKPGVIDVVVSDIDMPGVDGLTLRRYLHETHPKLPVILISGHVSAIRFAQGTESGGQRVLCKPFSLDELENAIDAAVAPHSESTRRDERESTLGGF